MGLVASGGALESLRLLGSKALQTHHAGRSVLAAAITLGMEFMLDTLTAADAVAAIVHGLDLLT